MKSQVEGKSVREKDRRKKESIVEIKEEEEGEIGYLGRTQG